MIKKLFKTVFAFILSLVLFSSGVLAVDSQDPLVSIVRLPEYLNKREFEISYTALDAGGSGLDTVAVSYKKEGEGWKSLGTFSDSSKKVKVTGSHVNTDAKYYFKAEACDHEGNCSSDETYTNIDTSAPPKPESFSKSKAGSQSYKIKWHNPDSDDLNKVYIYRSDSQEFTADDASKVAEVGVSKNTDSEWTDAVVPDSSKTYYYVIRNVDKAGNASDIVGDIKFTTVYKTEEPEGEAVSGDEALQGQEPFLSAETDSSGGGSGSILGEETEEATDEAKIATDSGELEKNGQEQETAANKDALADSIKRNSWWIWSLGGIALIGSLWYLLKKRK
jgi:hypothetical protein